MSIRTSKKEVERDEKGNILMTPHTLRVFCERDELYELPELNEKLYLHYKGFSEICGLEEYFNVKTLWLENNAIREIKNLECLPHLSFLFLQNNFLTEISGLENAENLHTLNLSNNKISVIRGLEGCKSLENLSMVNNLVDNEGLKGLLEVPSLRNLDLSNNELKFSQETFELFQRMPSLLVLTLKGNEYCREFSNYRKRHIVALPNLKHLDDRPVTPEERRLAIAWSKGGIEAEKEEREVMAEEKRESYREYVAGLKMDDNYKRQKRLEYIEKVAKELEAKISLLKAQLRTTEYKKYVEREISIVQTELEALRRSVPKAKAKEDNGETKGETLEKMETTDLDELE